MRADLELGKIIPTVQSSTLTSASLLDRESVRLCIERSDGEVAESGASGEEQTCHMLWHMTRAVVTAQKVVYVCEISIFNIATAGGGYPIVYCAHFRVITTLQQRAELKGIDKLRS